MSHLWSFLHAARTHFKSLLELSSLFLGIVNALFLLKFYLRDKPKLRVEPISPDVYQWWFRMPDGKTETQPTRRYGFLAYVSISNRGLRKVELEAWQLCIKNRLNEEDRMSALNMPEPKITIGSQEKYYPVLGQKGMFGDGNTLTEPGCSTSGMVFTKYECYGGEGWDPAIHDGKISTTFVVTDVFGGKCSCGIEFSQKTFEEINALAPDIHLIFEN
jgi:hypothetical protein